MTYNAARKWLVISSLIMISLYCAFLIIAPITPYPIEYSQALQILQILFPLFVGYLSSAVVFIFQGEDITKNLQVSPMLGILVKGPFIVVFILIVIALLAFGISNWPAHDSAEGNGMPFDSLSNLVSIILGIHTGTTSSLVLYLFKTESKNENS